jgi:hypothetical protein
MEPTNYEELTVPELKDLADKRGVEILSDARKAEIIAALEASDFLLQPTLPKQEEEGPAPEQQDNVYTQQMSSTETALISNEDFWKTKLHS